MLCPRCESQMRRFGYNRNGSQRYRCDVCEVTFTDQATQPEDGRRLPVERAVFCLRLLLEGTSIRATERLTGVHRDTIMHAMVEAGERCQSFLERTIRGIPVEEIQADEVWSFVYMKEKARHTGDYPEEGFGDCYTFTAIERNTKLLVAWHVGKRTEADTFAFAHKLRQATVGRFQLSTDGWHPYRVAIPAEFGHSLDFAVLVKSYVPNPDDRRYSPPQIVDITIRIQTGHPDEARICTSHVERHNKTLRMQLRRFTRLTDAHSKKWENHEAAIALFFAFYNFCRPHMTLTEEMGYRCTPAMRAGLTDHVWTVDELLENAASHG